MGYRELYGSPRDLYGSPMRQGSPLMDRLHALDQPLPGSHRHHERQVRGGTCMHAPMTTLSCPDMLAATPS